MTLIPVWGTDYKGSLISWKACPRTSLWVHWESSTAGCSLRRRPGWPQGAPCWCTGAGPARCSPSPRCPQTNSCTDLCHLPPVCCSPDTSLWQHSHTDCWIWIVLHSGIDKFERKLWVIIMFLPLVVLLADILVLPKHVWHHQSPEHRNMFGKD